LQLIAIGRDYIDPESIMKEKIIQDISAQRFTGKAEYKGKDLISYLQSLDLNNIILFWKQCENLMTQKYEETLKQDPLYAKSAVIKCVRCGTQNIIDINVQLEVHNIQQRARFLHK